MQAERSSSRKKNSNPHAFNLSRGGTKVTTVRGRRSAVDQAKELSATRHGSIKVERDDGRVEMTFRHGGLVTYRFRTR